MIISGFAVPVPPPFSLEGSAGHVDKAGWNPLVFSSSKAVTILVCMPLSGPWLSAIRAVLLKRPSSRESRRTEPMALLVEEHAVNIIL